MCQLNEKCICTSEKNKTDMPTSIRRSHIDTYEMCPYYFYLEVIQGHEVPETPYTMIGSDLHEIFDKYSWLKNDSKTFDNMMKDFKVYKNRYDIKMFKDDVQYRKLMERAENSIKNFIDLHQEMPMPYKTEERLYYDLGNGLPSISMAMDRVNKLEDGTYEVIDWKTGATLTGQKLALTLQVPTYILIIKENYNIDISRFRLEYVGEGKSRIYNIDNVNSMIYHCSVKKRTYTVSLDDTIKRLQKIMRDIKREDWNVKQSQKEYNCKHLCYFYENQCQGITMRQWQQ